MIFNAMPIPECAVFGNRYRKCYFLFSRPGLILKRSQTGSPFLTLLRRPIDLNTAHSGMFTNHKNESFISKPKSWNEKRGFPR